MHLAAYHGNFDVVKYLVEYGANENALTKDDETAYSLANGQGNTKLIFISKDSAVHDKFSSIGYNDISNYLREI